MIARALKWLGLRAIDRAKYKRKVNLLPASFSLWTRHATTVINSDVSITSNFTAGYQYNYVVIPVSPDTKYTFSVNIDANSDTAVINVEEKTSSNAHYKDNAETVAGGATGKYTKTITTTSSTFYLQIRLYSASAGTYSYSNPRLGQG